MRPKIAFLALIGTFACLSLWSCQSDSNGLSPEQDKMASNVDAWAKSSGGDWSKLTEEQRQTMIKSVGSEQSAKMVLQMKAHPPTAIGPGAPKH